MNRKRSHQFMVLCTAIVNCYNLTALMFNSNFKSKMAAICLFYSVVVKMTFE